MRVPFVARWSGMIPAGAVSDEPLMTIDIFPTVAFLLGISLPAQHIDGKNATSLLLGEQGATSPQEAYFFYYKKNDLEAMRCGRWKLHFPHGYRSMQGREIGNGGIPGKYDYGVKTGFELYDLANDPSETTNVAESHSDVMAKLTALADAMRADLGDNLTETVPSGQRMSGHLDSEQE